MLGDQTLQHKTGCSLEWETEKASRFFIPKLYTISTRVNSDDYIHFNKI